MTGISFPFTMNSKKKRTKAPIQQQKAKLLIWLNYCFFGLIICSAVLSLYIQHHILISQRAQSLNSNAVLSKEDHPLSEYGQGHSDITVNYPTIRGAEDSTSTDSPSKKNHQNDKEDSSNDIDNFPITNSKNHETISAVREGAPDATNRTFPASQAEGDIQAQIAETLGTKNNDDKTCVIHVGPHKTGSSTLQQFFLVKHEDDQAKDNYKSPIFDLEGPSIFMHHEDMFRRRGDPMLRHGGGHGMIKKHAALAQCIVTELEPTKCSTPDQRDIIEYFRLFVDDAAAHGSNILLSAEAFDQPNLNITQLTSILVPQQYKIHVVVYYRRFYDWIHSYHNQVTKGKANREKGKQHATFVRWLTDDMLEEAMQSYSVATYNRFKEAPGIFNVSVVNMHEDPDNFNTNARFACDHMDNAPHLCEIAKSIPAKHTNPSKSLDWKLFRKNIHIYHPIQLSDSDEDKLEQIEAKFDKIIDIPQLCLSPEWRDRLLQISIEFEKTLTPESWYNGKEGLENLKSEFEGKSNSKFCSVDIERILTSSEWQDFLTGLEEEIEAER